MTQYAYSPDTGELIRTETPSDWMGVTDAIPPDFNPETAGCFWRNGAWVIVTSAPGLEKLREDAKAVRQKAVSTIKVTTQAGNVFDGDEISQTRMARAIIGLNAQPQTPVPTITWVLADNTPKSVTATELTEALSLAGGAQAALWVI